MWLGCVRQNLYKRGKRLSNVIICLKMNEMMSHEECLRKIELPESIEKLHQAITEKFPINDKKFDAWYTNRPYVFQILTKLGQSIAGKLREDLRIEWRKGMPEHLWKLLEAKNTAPKNWEGSPDGALAGIAISHNQRRSLL